MAMNPPNPSTEPARDRPRHGARTDWAEVYRTVYPDLLRYLRWTLGDDDQAKDLAQEAFVRVLDRKADNPRGLVFRTATNLVKDLGRTAVRRRRHLKLLKVEEDVRGEAAPGPAKALEARERAEEVRQALDVLSERDRQVLLLWNAGMSYDEIAAETGLSKGALGTTIARAKKKLVSAHDALEATDEARG